MNKRVRSEAKSTTPQAPASQVAQELFDAMTTCSRRQHAQILSVLIKASSAVALELAREEAVKCRAIVPTTSRFQKCSRQFLDSCFSFLDRIDLSSVELVCGHWRYACLDAGAGWLHALSRPVVSGTLTLLDEKWAAEVARHRINPSRMISLDSAYLGCSQSAMTVAARLPNVKQLCIHPSVKSAELSLLASYNHVESLTAKTKQLQVVLSAQTRAKVTAIDWLSAGCFEDIVTPRTQLQAALAQFRSLTSLRADPFELPEQALNKLPLRSVDFHVRFRLYPDRTDWHVARVAELSSVSTLTELQLSKMRCSLQLFTAIGALMQLTRLKLCDIRIDGAEMEQDVFAPLRGLINLTALTFDLQPGVPESQDEADAAEKARFLSNLVNLEELHGFPVVVSDASLQPLAPLRRLRELDLSNAVVSRNFSAKAFEQLQHVPLRQVNLSSWDAHDSVLLVLRAVLAEAAVDICTCPSRSRLHTESLQGLKAFAELAQLQRLILPQNRDFNTKQILELRAAAASVVDRQLQQFCARHFKIVCLVPQAAELTLDG